MRRTMDDLGQVGNGSFRFSHGLPWKKNYWLAGKVGNNFQCGQGPTSTFAIGFCNVDPRLVIHYDNRLHYIYISFFRQGIRFKVDVNDEDEANSDDDIDRFDWRVRPVPDRNLEEAIRFSERLDGKRSSRKSRYVIKYINTHKPTYITF